MKKLMLILSFILVLGFSSIVQAAGFQDVQTSHPFYKHINYLYDEGIVNGVDADHYKPSNFVTRSQAALMVARALNLNLTAKNTIFTDVGDDHHASGAIQSAADAGIINGYPDGTFKPNNYVTRGQMASFIARAFEMEEEALPFADVPLNSSAYSDIRKATAFGVVSGYANGEFRPNNSVTRAHFAGFLARALNDDLRLTADTCGYDPNIKSNPDRQTMNCLLTTAARNAEVPIPAEIVKGIASVESNGWIHFQSNGEPIISSDGGIGLMQITSTAGYDVERIKYDLVYNIDTAIDMLGKNYKRSSLPKIENAKPEDLEGWYFAIMAYNGTKAVNSPVYQATGKRNTNAYQERVYQTMEKNGLLETSIDLLDFKKEDFIYAEETNNIEFVKKSYPLTSSTLTTEEYGNGDKVKYNGSGLRSSPSTQSPLTSITKGSVVTIIGSPVFDENKNSTNHFVWYPVQTVINGKSVTGYIASPYIVK